MIVSRGVRPSTIVAGLIVGISVGLFAIASPLILVGLLCGTGVVLLFLRYPLMGAGLILVTTPFVDQLGQSPLAGGIDAAGVIRGTFLIVMIFTLLLRARGGAEHRTLKPMMTTTAICFGALSLSYIFSIAPSNTLKNLLAVLFWMTWFIYIRCFLVDDGGFKILRWSMLLGALVIAITMFPYEVHHVYGAYDRGTAIFGKYNGPFNLALSIVFVLPVFAFHKSRAERFVFGLVGLFLLYIWLHTFVRTSLMVLVIYLFGVLITNKTARRWVTAIGIMVALGLLLHVVHLRVGNWTARLTQGTNLNSFSSGRLGLYQAALKGFWQLPWGQKIFGIGYGNTPLLMLQVFGEALIAQNDFLDALVGAGVLGLIGLLQYVFWIGKKLYAMTSLRNRAIGITIFVAILAVALINGIFMAETSAMLFATTTLCFALFADTGSDAIHAAVPTQEPHVEAEI